ncbi:MAG: tetratricopeptide repeat protein [Sedimentisphaerales bacterium]|jgi:tetratricopeptide (TPR) repeat protein
MSQQTKKSLVLSIYFALAVSTLLVFWQVRNFGFVDYDDGDYVSANPYVLNGLTADGVLWAFTTNRSANWHPLTWLSFMLDRQLFGPSPAGFHLTNLFFHIANTLLLFLVLKQMTKAIWPSAFVAAAFALHPMHVESVAWITERKDVLSALFWILTIAAYYRYTKRPGIARYLLTLLVFALGLMAKPMLVTLPFVLLLLDYWPLERKISWRLLVEKIPFFVLSIISSIITFLVQRNAGAVNDIDIFSLNNRIANVFLSYVVYIAKMFWPYNLAIFYPFDVVRVPFLQVAMCVLLLLVISFLVVRLGRNQKYLPVGWFWFVASLVPVIGIVQVGSKAYADRYTYIPYIGLFIMLGWSLPQLLSKWPYRKIIFGLSMAVVLTPLGICAHQQTSYWKNSLILFSHAVEVTQNNYIAYDRLGVAYARLDHYTDAMDNFSRAIKIKPDYAQAYFDLGCAYDKLGRAAEAIDAYKQAIKFSPGYIMAYNNLGVVYGRLGRYNEAIDIYKQAVKIKPDLVEAHNNLGFAYLATGDKNSALAEYNILKSLNPEMANKLLNQINK